MNEGNCVSCGKALHTKIRVTAHPILGWDENGPIRGNEKDFHICSSCVGEDIGAKVGVPNPAATPTPKK